jgi:hypothetical protein
MGNRDMELKNAAAVCLISLVSATLVVLVARALDNQAASQLEPRLTEIAEELRALRRQGGVARSDDAAQQETVGDGLIVYYFHSDARCPSCRAIESVTKETLDTRFSAQLGRGEIVWKILNYSKPSGALSALKFEVKDPVVVLARMKGGEIEKWNRLDQVMALAGDKAALAKYIREEIERMLAAEKKPTNENKPAKKTPAIPIPK